MDSHQYLRLCTDIGLLYRYQELLKTMSGSFRLFFEFVHKDVSRIEDHHREAIKAIFSLFLSSASRLRCFVDSNSDLGDAYNKQITTAIEAFYNQVSLLFKNVYGLSFGRCGRDFMEYYSRLELKVRMQTLTLLATTFLLSCSDLDVLD